MADKKVFPSDIQRACVALQLAVFEYTGEIRSQMSDEQSLSAMAQCSAEIARMCKVYLKQENA